MSQIEKISYIVNPNDFINAGCVSEDIRKKLTKINVNAENIRKATLAIYETELNMVVHANGGLIEAEFSTEYIKIKAEDNGPGIPDIERALEPGFSTLTPDDEIHSRGIGSGQGFSKIRTSTDRFDIETELGCGTTITFEIDF